MVSDKFVNFIPIAVTESAASTLTEDEIDVATSFINRIALVIHKIDLHHDMVQDDPAAAAQETLTFALTTQPMAAMPTINDDYVIWRYRFTARGAATGGGGIFNVIGSPYTFPIPLIVAQQKLYAYLQTTNSSNAGYCHGRIHVTYVRLTENEWREAWETWAPTG